MHPIPTRTGITAYVGATALLLVGLALNSVIVTVWAGVLFVAMAVALALTMPLGRRVRRMHLEFAWWTAAQNVEGAVVPGAPFEVRCLIRHRAPFPITLTGLDPIVPAGARVGDAEGRTLVLAPRERSEFRFQMVADAVGRTVLHGLAVRVPGPCGLFETPLYFPNPLVIKVLPRVAGVMRTARVMRAGLPVERHGLLQQRRRGGGTELHELRELVPGDPFRSIAWKASARARKLMVREVEQEVQETRWLVLDMGTTLRSGRLGDRPLDNAIDHAASVARRAIDSGDRVGFIAVDGRVVRVHPPGDDRSALLRLYDALLAITEVVDEDLTDIDDPVLETWVGEYLQRQDGVDFSRRGEMLRWDVGRMVRHVRKQIRRTDDASLLARDPSSATLRRFCQERGIALPYRSRVSPGEKTQGILLALRHIIGSERSPSTVTIVSDFDDIFDETALGTSLRLLRAHGHHPECALVEPRALPPSPKDGIAHAMWLAVLRSEEARVARVARIFRRHGASFHVVGSSALAGSHRGWGRAA